MSNYAKGANRERAWMVEQMRQGALWTGRMAGSHGKVDVVALYPDRMVMAQIKTGSARASGEEIASLKRLAGEMNGHRVQVEVRLYSYPKRQPVKVTFF